MAISTEAVLKAVGWVLSAALFSFRPRVARRAQMLRRMELEKLRRGHCAVFEEAGISLEIKSDDTVQVGLASEWLELTPEFARRDFDRARANFAELMETNAEVRQIVGTRQPRYELVIDYGKSSVSPCYLEGDEIVWYSGHPGYP